jgi:hypothetical protein
MLQLNQDDSIARSASNKVADTKEDADVEDDEGKLTFLKG